MPVGTYDFGGGIVSRNGNVEVLLTPVVNALLETPSTILSFAGVTGETYEFDLTAYYTTNADTTGARFTVIGVGTPTSIMYRSRWTLTATTEFFTNYVAEGLPAASGATSLAAGSTATIQGRITPSADGLVEFQVASEVAIANAVTVLAGTRLAWRQLT